MTSPENPLTPRVIVNRIWQHHFGQGLVRSPDNFGYTGEQPTHPELLDWLASELLAHNWDLQHIHRLILTSATYQQTSDHPCHEDYVQRDAANRYWWRANRRRLDAESLHDALLTASGEMDLRIGGPSFKPTVSAEALEGLSRKSNAWEASPEREQHRRGLYTFMQRSLLPPLMTVFDLCDSTMPCGQREETIVPPQALTLLNNPFVHRRAEKLAIDLLADSVDPGDRARSLWRTTLQRNPTEGELKAALAHVARQQQRFQATAAEDSPTRESIPVTQGLALWLDADEGLEVDAEGNVVRWLDRRDGERWALQPVVEYRPRRIADAIAGRSAVHFDGQRRYLSLPFPMLTAADCTIFVVVTDQGAPGHREILSNWSGRDGNSVNSLFLGLTDEDRVRFSDDFSPTGRVVDRAQPFVLAAVNGPNRVAVFQNSRLLGERSRPLTDRRFDTPWVIGQQGNINGEYWQGNLACLLVYQRPLSTEELDFTTKFLRRRYALASNDLVDAAPSPETLAWASLAVVLMNTNEFLYVD